ncbi:hypothetical protein AB4027_07290 [Alkalibacterium putridalgicola]|uniref:hypothetical protein n=1 Tax=Alkalibacterium putridalgicola TaxID=426703 RepID=UPI0034CED755
MGLFGGNKEEKIEIKLEAEREYINSIKGKYVAAEFQIVGEKYATTQLYPQIAAYANNHNLEIVNIGKPEEGLALHTRIAVIYKKAN